MCCNVPDRCFLERELTKPRPTLTTTIHTSWKRRMSCRLGGLRNIGKTPADRRAARAKRRRARTVQHNATQEHSGRNNPRSVTRWRCPKRGGSYVTWRTCGLDCGVGTGWSVRPTGAVFLNSNMKEDSPPSSTTVQEHTGAVRNHMKPATTVAAPKQTEGRT